MNAFTALEQQMLAYIKSREPEHPSGRDIAAHLWPNESFRKTHYVRLCALKGSLGRKGIAIKATPYKGYRIIEQGSAAE